MKATHSILLILLAASATVEAQMVVARAERLSLLSAAENHRTTAIPALQADAVAYPFDFNSTASIATDGDRQETECSWPLSDAYVLSQLAPTVQPSGVITRDGQHYLVTAQGALTTGSAVEATFENNTYNIGVINVTADSYTLKLNDASLTRPIDPGANTRGAQRDK